MYDKMIVAWIPLQCTAYNSITICSVFVFNAVLSFLWQSTDVCEQILRVVSRSNRLEELVLENAGLRT